MYVLSLPVKFPVLRGVGNLALSRAICKSVLSPEWILTLTLSGCPNLAREQKAIRDRMKELMGVGADERLPSPHDPQPGPADPAFLGGSRIYHRPDWKAGVKNEANKTVRP